jgi:hypothetical protein
MADMKDATKETGVKPAAKEKENGNGNGQDALNNLLISGAQFLTNLSKTISQPEQSAGNNMDSMIGRDVDTGKAYLKIPLPETDAVKNIFSTLGELISNTMQMRNKE